MEQNCAVQAVRARTFEKNSPTSRRIRRYNMWLPDDLFQEHLVHFPIVTTDLVITDNNLRFLLLRRSDNNYGWKGYWATPGGRIFRNESLADAAHRILMRETSLDIPPENFMLRGIQEIFTRRVHAVTIVFEAESSKIEVTVDATSSQGKWFDVMSAPKQLRPEYKSILSMCDIHVN